MLFSAVRNPTISALELNHEYSIIGHINGNYFNPEPNKHAVEVLFPTKNNSPIQPIFFNGTEITKTTSTLLRVDS